MIVLPSNDKLHDIELTEYHVSENIRSDNFALQVCVIATDVDFEVKVSQWDSRRYEARLESSIKQ